MKLFQKQAPEFHSAYSELYKIYQEDRWECPEDTKQYPSQGRNADFNNAAYKLARVTRAAMRSAVQNELAVIHLVPALNEAFENNESPARDLLTASQALQTNYNGLISTANEDDNKIFGGHRSVSPEIARQIQQEKQENFMKSAAQAFDAIQSNSGLYRQFPTLKKYLRKLPDTFEQVK